MLRMLRSRSLVLFCVHVGGFVFDARARLLCLFAFSVGPSVGPGVCSSVLSCSVLCSFVFWANATFVFVCLFVLILLCFCTYIVQLRIRDIATFVSACLCVLAFVMSCLLLEAWLFVLCYVYRLCILYG